MIEFKRVNVWGSWILLGFMLAVTVSAWSQTQDELERRIHAQENINADVRLTRLETRLDGIQNIGAGILIIVAAQLVMNGLNLRARRDR